MGPPTIGTPIRLSLFICLSLLCGLVEAARPVRYRYGDAWWFEYEADLDTALLPHFGKPQRRAARELAKQLRKAREKKQAEKRFMDELTEFDDVLRDDVRGQLSRRRRPSDHHHPQP